MRNLSPALRCRLPIVVGALLLFGTFWAGTIATWLMLIAGFGLILDGVTKWWERAGGTGNLTTHKQ
jgi:hypothetical protein